MIHKALIVSPRDSATMPRENTPTTVKSHQMACLETRFMTPPVISYGQTICSGFWKNRCSRLEKYRSSKPEKQARYPPLKKVGLLAAPLPQGRAGGI